LQPEIRQHREEGPNVEVLHTIGVIEIVQCRALAQCRQQHPGSIGRQLWVAQKEAVQVIPCDLDKLMKVRFRQAR
jgi:hypothetical protein